MNQSPAARPTKKPSWRHALTERQRKIVVIESMRAELQRACYEIGLHRELYTAVCGGNADGVARALARIASFPTQRVRRLYTADFRQECLRQVGLVGAAVVARRYDVPYKTVICWCQRAGVASSGVAPHRRRKPRRTRTTWLGDNRGYAPLYDWQRPPTRARPRR